MIEFDNLTAALLKLYQKTHPEVSEIDAGRYVIGVMSGIGHIIDTMLVEKEPPRSGPKGYVLNTFGKVTDDDLIWDRRNRCWVVASSNVIGQPRTSLIGVASTLKRITIDKVTEQFEGKFVYQGQTPQGLHTFRSDKQEMHASWENDRLMVSIKCTKS